MHLTILKYIRTLHACVVTSLGFMATLYIDSYSSPIEDALLQDGLFNEQSYPFFGSATFLGACISCSVAGPICEYLGIKSTLLIFSPISIVGSILLILAYDPISMIVARILIGIYCGLSISCVPVYNAEISPEGSKKYLGSLFNIAFGCGIVLSYSLGIWIGFRWLVVIYLFIIVFMNLNLVFLPESPRWLSSKGLYEEEKRAENYFNETSETHPLTKPVKAIFENGIVDVEKCEERNISKYFSWPIFKPLLICCSVQFFKTSSGYMLLLDYSAHTVENGVKIDPRIVSLFYGIFLLCGSIVFVFIINKVAWKPLLIVSSLFLVLSNCLLSLVFYLSINVFHCSHLLYSDTTTALCNVLQYSPIILLSVNSFTMSVGMGSLSWWLYGEILHSHYARVSAGIVTFVCYTSAYLNQMIAPLLVSYLGTDIVFLGYSVLGIIGVFVQYLY